MTYSRFLMLPAVLAASLALGGCGLNSSPADKLTFKAPAGWQGSPGIMGFMQFWKPSGSKNEVLMLFKSPKALTTTEVFKNADLTDAKVKQQRSIAICGNQPAQYYRAVGTSKNGGDSNIEMVMSNENATTYMAMYVYPAGGAANGDAESALRELCTKS